MRVFTDAARREWRLTANVASFKRVRERCGVNLYEALHPEGPLPRLERDPLLLGDVLFALCEPQARAAGLSAEQFGEGLAGDAIAAATTALLEELPDFFQSPQREALRAILEAGQRLATARTAAASQALSDPQLPQRLDQALQSWAGPPSEPAGNAPGSSG